MRWPVIPVIFFYKEVIGNFGQKMTTSVYHLHISPWVPIHVITLFSNATYSFSHQALCPKPSPATYDNRACTLWLLHSGHLPMWQSSVTSSLAPVSCPGLYVSHIVPHNYMAHKPEHHTEWKIKPQISWFHHTLQGCVNCSMWFDLILAQNW